MSGHDITTAFMWGTAVMFAVCWGAVLFRREALEIAAAGAVVFLFTVVSRIWSANTAMPMSAAPWPVQDVICGLLATALYTKHKEPWKLALAFCFGVQCAAHVAYWWVVASGSPTRLQTVNYLWVINPFFALELLILTGAGGRHIAGHVLDRLRVFSGADPFAGQGIARGR